MPPHRELHCCCGACIARHGVLAASSPSRPQPHGERGFSERRNGGGERSVGGDGAGDAMPGLNGSGRLNGGATAGTA
jgi:hypothetical protein